MDVDREKFNRAQTLVDEIIANSSPPMIESDEQTAVDILEAAKARGSNVSYSTVKDRLEKGVVEGRYTKRQAKLPNGHEATAYKKVLDIP